MYWMINNFYVNKTIWLYGLEKNALRHIIHTSVTYIIKWKIWILFILIYNTIIVNLSIIK